MARPVEEGIPALYNYQAVKYHHVPVEPGANLILTSDPWSFLFAWLTKKSERMRGNNRQCFRRAIYYASLAESFYSTAQASDFPAKGTLSYYGMLNLVKCFISVKGVQLEKDYEHHGLTMPLGEEFKLQINPDKSGISIFAEFARLLGKPIDGKDQLLLSEICLQIPEIHEMSHNIGIAGTSRRQFLPVSLHILVNESIDKVFTELRYEKKHEARIDTSKVLRGPREQYFNRITDEGNWVRLRSKRRKSLPTKKSWKTVYANILKEYEPFDIASILSRQGYRYYLNLRPGVYHQLSYTLALMFYLGSVGRYRPSETEKLLEGKYRPVVGEAVAMLPAQFLYQIVSRTTESVCVIPLANID